MKGYTDHTEGSNTIFVGVDLHRWTWHVTVRTDEAELFSGSIPGRWTALRNILERYGGNRIQVVYEAGYFGFWLYDCIVEWGAECIVPHPVCYRRNMATG